MAVMEATGLYEAHQVVVDLANRGYEDCEERTRELAGTFRNWESKRWAEEILRVDR